MSERDLVIAALERDDLAERDVYLAQACGGDADLRRRVERLLRLHGQAGSFLEGPPAAPGETVDPQTGNFLDGPEHTNAQGIRTADPTPAGGHPSHIGRYRVERLLGEGGFGRVYLAHDDQLRRPVTVKVPYARLVALAGDAEAYRAEARTVASLDHPHIVPAYDVGSTDQFHASAESDDLLALHEAMDRLTAAEPHVAELVTLRYFAGLSLPQAAETLGISLRTAERWWAYARAWLLGELESE